MKTSLLITLLLLTLVSAGSSLAFERKMGDPLTGAPDPDAVLRLMEISVTKRDFKEYRKVLADSFVYEADLGTVAMYDRIDWDAWGIAQEEDFLRRLLSPSRKAELQLTNLIRERGMPYNNKAKYELTYTYKLLGQTFQGEATFIFVEVENLWFLWKWTETMPVTNQNTGTFFSNSGEVRASLGP